MNRSYAKQLSAQIERDMQASYFDENLLKYRPRRQGNNFSNLTAAELFEKYSAARANEKSLAPGFRHRYQAIASNLRLRLGDKSAHLVTEAIAKDIMGAMVEVANWCLIGQA